MSYPGNQLAVCGEIPTGLGKEFSSYSERNVPCIMIYLFTALYCEAHVFIRHFHLVKNPENKRFQEFYHEAAGIRLTITGVGEIRAASAVSSICAVYPPAPDDLLINVGTCAKSAEGGGIFLCHKIIEQSTGKTFYPDMLYRHDFEEEVIVTGMLPLSGAAGRQKLQAADFGGMLYDMEAAAIYQAGSYFFGPHQMIFLKIVSDNGAAREVSPEKIEVLMEKCGEDIFSYLRRLTQLQEKVSREVYPAQVQQREEALLERLSADLHCSKAMRDSLRQYIRYLLLTGEEEPLAIQEMYEKGFLPCRDKKEGKQRFEEFKRRLF